MAKNQLDDQGSRLSDHKRPFGELDERDINDVFEDIMQCEERIAKQSYKDGWEAGHNQGKTEGYLLGYSKGLEIGQELGEMYGFIVALEQLPQKTKTTSIIRALKLAIEQFPQFNDYQQDVLSMLTHIRNLNKHLQSNLGIKSNHSDEIKKNLSF